MNCGETTKADSRGLARADPGPHPDADPGGRPRDLEERKWKKPSNTAGVPVWSHDGIVCTGETYKSVVKVTFFKGASLKDPTGLFNSSLEGNARRAIDFHEGDKLDEKALKALVRQAVTLNGAGKSKPKKGKS